MKKTLLLLISILAISCNNDENNPQTDKTALTLVTGLDLRETSDDMGLQLGNPNVLINKKFVLYPNPADKDVYISAVQNITDVWLVPATPEKIYQDVNFSTILKNDLYTEQTILSNSNLTLTGLDTNLLQLNLSNLPIGYYKVFVKIGGVIYWDNLYKHHYIGNETQLDDVKNFWK